MAAENEQLQKPQDAGATGDGKGKGALGSGSIAQEAKAGAIKAPVKVCLSDVKTNHLCHQSAQHTGHTLVAAEQAECNSMEANCRNCLQEEAPLTGYRKFKQDMAEALQAQERQRQERRCLGNPSLTMREVRPCHPAACCIRH